jgi:DNA-binding CsgD family transcriptional regulator
MLNMSSHFSEELSDLIGSIYDCAAGTRDWQSLVAEIATVFRADKCNILSSLQPDTETGIWVAHGLSFSDWQHYVDYYCERDVLTKRGLELGCYFPGNVVSDEEIIRKSDLARTEFYRDFWQPQGIHSAIAAVVSNSGPNGAPPAVMGIYRGAGHSGFSPNEVDLAKQITPHLGRALAIHYRTRDLQAKAELGAQAIDALGLAMCIVDGQGKLFHLNQRAKRLLDSPHCGLSFKAGRLAASTTSCQSELIGLLRGATGCPAVGGAMFLDRFDRFARQLFVSPLPASSPLNEGRNVALALLLILEPDQSITPLQLVGRLYGLSPAETAVATSLLEGDSLDEYAESAGVAISTARTQLKSLFAKTGTRRQAELVALLSKVPPLKG